MHFWHLVSYAVHLLSILITTALHSHITANVCAQIRKGKKHTAEYKADRPLCGTWAEIDGESASVDLAVNLLSCITLFADHPLHDDLLLCATEDSLAPMDDFLRASLPATVVPLVMTHLPELDVSQPDKVRCDCLLYWYALQHFAYQH